MIMNYKYEKIWKEVIVVYFKAQGFSLFATASRRALKPIQPPIKWALGTLPSGSKAAGA